MRRRALLSTAATGAASLAGCLDGLSELSPGGDATRRVDFGEAVTVGEQRATINDALVRESIVYTLVDTKGVAGTDGQFLLANLHASSGRVDPERFEVVAGDESYEGTAYPGSMGAPATSIGGVGQSYVMERTRGWIGFELPARLPVESASIRLAGTGETAETTAIWPVDDGVVADLAAPPPSFELRSVEVPEPMTETGEFDVAVTAANVGDRPETFRGVLNVRYAYSAAIELDLGPGEERTWRDTVAWDPDSGWANVAVTTVAGGWNGTVAPPETTTGTQG